MFESVQKLNGGWAVHILLYRWQTIRYDQLKGSLSFLVLNLVMKFGVGKAFRRRQKVNVETDVPVAIVCLFTLWQASMCPG